MSRIIKAIYLLIAIVLSMILIWMIAIPDNLIKSGIEDSISDSLGNRFNASIDGFRKTPLLAVHTDSLLIKMDEEEIIKIRELIARLKPLHIIKKKLMFSLIGKIGDGKIDGEITLPFSIKANRADTGQGVINISNVGLNAILYLNHVGFKGKGHLSAEIYFKGNSMKIRFEVADLNIINPGIFFFPLIETFHDVQGVINIHEGNMDIESIGLEGKKGYARVKGIIRRDLMDLNLELMPYPDRLTQVESLLISKYQVSPGYYIIPFRGKLKNASL